MTKTLTTDQTVNAVSLPSHPMPHVVAKALRDAADRLDKHGLDAIDMVHVLAARGYSASTLGDGGSRATDSTSSTERHAIPDREDRWWGADVAYAQSMADVYRLAGKLRSDTDEILRHAQDIDPTPAGTGECLACGRFCRPDKDKPGNRLRSGLCPTDYRAWLRDGQPLRAEWVRARRASFTDPDTRILHTPEPDHDIDLTTEKAPEPW